MVRVSYTAGTNKIRDAAHNNSANLTNSGVTNSTTDTVAPTFTSAAVNGTSLTLTYDENLDG